MRQVSGCGLYGMMTARLPVLWVAYVLGSRKGFNSRGRPAALGGILLVTSQPT